MEQAGGIVLFPIMIGFAPPNYGNDLLARFAKAPITNPFQAYLAATVALARGEAHRAGQITDSMLARDTTAYPAFLRGLFVAAHGWRQVLAGDSTQGLHDLARGLEMAGGAGGTFLNGPPRLQLALIMAARPDSRAEGIHRLKHGFDNDLGLLPVVYFALGRASEAQGDKAGATEAYSQFLRLWDKADSSAQGTVREAREGLRRVTVEPR
jgi:predicted Zn-dependent protease